MDKELEQAQAKVRDIKLKLGRLKISYPMSLHIRVSTKLFDKVATYARNNRVSFSTGCRELLEKGFNKG